MCQWCMHRRSYTVHVQVTQQAIAQLGSSPALGVKTSPHREDAARMWPHRLPVGAQDHQFRGNLVCHLGDDICDGAGRSVQGLYGEVHPVLHPAGLQYGLHAAPRFPGLTLHSCQGYPHSYLCVAVEQPCSCMLACNLSGVSHHRQSLHAVNGALQYNTIAGQKGRTARCIWLGHTPVSQEGLCHADVLGLMMRAARILEGERRTGHP